MLKSSYPALYDPGNKSLHALLGSASFVIGRSETANLTVLDLNCSRQQFRIIRVEAQHYVEPLSRTSPTYHNGQSISAYSLGARGSAASRQLRVCVPRQGFVGRGSGTRPR